MPPPYETTQYAEITQFLRAPVKADEETIDESNEGDRDDFTNKESSTHEDNAGYAHDVEGQEILLEI